MGLNLFTLPADTPFLDALARGWLARAGSDPISIARGMILLPTRRSSRALAEAFLRVTDGHPLLLPRITALGALDEAPLSLAGVLDLPPPVEPMQRLAALTRLILAMDGDGGAPSTADGAWRLAEDLAALMDEAERAEIDLRATLPDAADPAFAEHWARTLEFLRIVTEFWPQWLDDNGLMNPAQRQVALLEAQARAWTETPPTEPVLIAGTTAGIPAVARLLKVVARAEHGQVVLPALDMGMTDAAWDAIDDSHPQAGLARLLADLGATRGDVLDWDAAHAPSTRDRSRSGPSAPADRFGMLSAALLPASALDSWQQPGIVALDGLSRLTAADQQEDAEAIALILRDTLETPGARAALITPDRSLAARVTAALARAGIVADDSAGEKLIDAPPAVFLRLLVRAVADRFAPVPLLALLKHPLAGAGLSTAACRSEARELEIACLRGPRPPSGLAGLRRTVDRVAEQRGDDRLKTFLAQLESCLEPVMRVETAASIAPSIALTALIAAGERLATTTETAGADRLWAGEEGAALAERLASVLAVADMLPEQGRGVLPGFLDAILDGGVVRGRRAVRGRDGTEHPRVFIWGLLEARLQSVDRIVLGGLTEGVWPPQTDPGPWLSRPMRTRVGLPSPEIIVGQAAHDFLSAACSAPDIVLSCPVRHDGAPAVPARWLTRLEAYLAGQGEAGLPAHPAAGWARMLDIPPDGPRPVKPPAPVPAPHLRPRRLSVTQVETWLRDPYAIYARAILGLQKLKPLEEETDAADYGDIVHDGLRQFLAEVGNDWPPATADRLRRAMTQVLARSGVRPALAAWWRPRLERIADWVAEREIERRATLRPANVQAEARGAMALPRPGGVFNLVGRADRIDRRPDGSIAIIDYKTGIVPSRKAIEAGYASQLLLEAMMAEAGGFGPGLQGPPGELIYWRLTGGAEAGAETRLFAKTTDDLAGEVIHARARLEDLIDAFDQPDRAYLSQPNAAEAPRFADYALLARVAEWSAAGDDDPGESTE